jgi:hypothetical protein
MASPGPSVRPAGRGAEASAPFCLGLWKHDIASRMSNLRARLQMPNTINATNPMPANSTTSETKSYSSQCRLRMMFVSSLFQIDFCLECETRWTPHIHRCRSKIVAFGHVSIVIAKGYSGKALYFSSGQSWRWPAARITLRQSAR